MIAPLPMTKGRRVVLLLGLPVALAIIGWTGLTAVAYAGQASYPVRLAVPVHGSTVSLSAGHADVPGGKRALISTGSGNVTLAGVSGPVSAGTGSGDVSGNAVSGANVAFKTGSGNISVAGLAGAKVTASSGSGDITLTFTEVPAHVRVSTGSGNISLVLPRGNTLYQVNAATDSGGRVVTVPTSSASRHVITVSAGSGNISITN